MSMSMSQAHPWSYVLALPWLIFQLSISQHLGSHDKQDVEILNKNTHL